MKENHIAQNAMIDIFGSYITSYSRTTTRAFYSSVINRLAQVPRARGDRNGRMRVSRFHNTRPSHRRLRQKKRLSARARYEMRRQHIVDDNRPVTASRNELLSTGHEMPGNYDKLAINLDALTSFA